MASPMHRVGLGLPDASLACCRTTRLYPIAPAPVIMVNCDLPRRLNLAKRTEFLARRAQAKPNGVFEKYQILVLKIMACRNLEIVLCSCTSEPIFLELPSANRH